jgi:hypothetical protein
MSRKPACGAVYIIDKMAFLSYNLVDKSVPTRLSGGEADEEK